MMVEPFFVLLCKSLDFARHNFHFQVSVEVIVSNVLVPRCTDNVSEYFVLESLYNVNILLCCEPRIGYPMSKRVLVLNTQIES